ncbi:hypothetical protein VIGAN_UM153200 [Vigna angularis var. angularis]|uniref:Uncharacterized protein n=1 Tax=Vigna angularis var. angularis TaxID=157739 RepID=A0A0S3TEZ1_PHAAN|nr:hypothetical protein VIGAN_UM153200 [Vigna angularis var. angularis]
MAFSDRGSLLQAPPNLYKVLLAFSQPPVAYVVVRHSYYTSGADKVGTVVVRLRFAGPIRSLRLTSPAGWVGLAIPFYESADLRESPSSRLRWTTRHSR